MPFSLPEDLAPELYPLAWLVGSWRGFGMLGYPNVPEQAFVQELTFDHDGGPYLRATSRMWLADAERSGPIAQEMTGTEGADALVPGTLWVTETAYWRPVPGPGAVAQEDGEPGAPGSELEVVLADPAGHLTVYVGAVRGPRVDLASDAVVRTATAAEMTGATRMYGLVQSDLLWAMDMAAFGEELQSYASGRLSRSS
ncbi:FABP family protein [Georgenia sp. 10Sc9-8]|uniref:Ferric nitrobindin-like protein n=1 Tax=Georgenia halotolerans TaxID=3028317 RepID=A0ABT5TYS3_9MICO|nr:FABP family protein [Georgenia halotolerans]